MPADLLWKPRARKDLVDIYATIGRENLAAAERLFEALVTKAELLKHYPRLGVRRADIRPSMRILIEGNYLLLYKAVPDREPRPVQTIEIVRVMDGRRD